MRPARWIALLPGSRKKELRLNLPAMLGAAERLGDGFRVRDASIQHTAEEVGAGADCACAPVKWMLS